MAVAPNPQDITPQSLQQAPMDVDQPDVGYWRDGSKVFWRRYHVPKADADTFAFFSGGFGKDKHSCYCLNQKLVVSNPLAFRALNFTYATDDVDVWCIAGKVKGADASTFSVCDDGRYVLDDRVTVPHSYARDRSNVYFYNFDGKAHVVRGADPSTFRSTGEGIFGLDGESVFAEAKRLKGVNVRSWRKLGGNFSADDKSVYFFQNKLEVVDLTTFRVVPSRMHAHSSWAMDANHLFHGNEVLTEDNYFYRHWLQDAAVELI